MEFILPVLIGAIVFSFIICLSCYLAENAGKLVEIFGFILVAIPLFWFTGKLTIKLLEHLF